MTPIARIKKTGGRATKLGYRYFCSQNPPCFPSLLRSPMTLIRLQEAEKSHSLVQDMAQKLVQHRGQQLTDDDRIASTAT